MTQIEQVKKRLKTHGFVDNFWAIQHNILRLSAIILLLKKEGFEFERGYGREFKRPRQYWKNYYYYLQK
jgi:hypothetical protein